MMFWLKCFMMQSYVKDFDTEKDSLDKEELYEIKELANDVILSESAHLKTIEDGKELIEKINTVLDGKFFSENGFGI